jgi:uncharacterized protein involved in response to NO
MPTALRLTTDPPASARVERPVAAKGFRLFFLLASGFAVAIVPLWIAVLLGALAPASYADAMTWHAHEMVFGFAVAVIAGFLLTAVGNWTQRETVVGKPLLGLGGLWLAGRVAWTLGAYLPPWLVTTVDLAFLPALIVALARPLVAARSTRNFVMLALLSALFAANVAVHLGARGLLANGARRGVLVAVDLVLVVVVVIAARVFPMFTRNATGVREIGSIAALDVLSVVAMVALALLDAVGPGGRSADLFAGLAGALVLARTARWGTRHTLRAPLLWVLHLGHLWIPVGLGLRALSAFLPSVPPAAATHALTTGAIGTLTLGMMARVSLGHSGRPLESSRRMTVAFACVTFAAILRVATPILLPALYRPSLVAVATLWTLAFGLFVSEYAPVLTAPRIDGRPG